MAREIRVSPDGDSVAIRSDNAEGAWNEWGVFNAINGGHWAAATEVNGWSEATEFTAPPAPEPAGPPTPTHGP